MQLDDAPGAPQPASPAEHGPDVHQSPPVAVVDLASSTEEDPSDEGADSDIVILPASPSKPGGRAVRPKHERVPGAPPPPKRRRFHNAKVETIALSSDSDEGAAETSAEASRAWLRQRMVGHIHPPATCLFV